ncbi:MAG TPA: DUF697 domain-containing protein [Methylothermaceae bacterium]|nr:DUF697 domain-containing protein [Methylothermaceae bacterium]
MSYSAGQRFVGVDLGTTNSSVCYTRYNEGKRQFDDPKPVKFGNDRICRSLLLLDADGQTVVANGEEVYYRPEFWRYPERVHQEFKLALGKEAEAARYTRLLAMELLDQLKQTLHIRELAPEEHVTTVGVPAEWQEKYPDRVETVEKAVRDAGFPNVAAVSEPIAAMYYHAFLGDIQFEDRPQRWLVVDIGGGTTDLAIIETAEPGSRPKIVYTYGERFGGTDFDQLLIEKLILQRHWVSPEPPTPEEMLGLQRFVREFKERFSNYVNRRLKTGVPDSFKWDCPMTGVRNPVALSYEEFRSNEMARPLIDRFGGILQEGIRRSGLSAPQIDRVILTGGSARWYFVRETATDFLQWKPILSKNPELTIAMGLALARTGFRLPHQRFLPTVAEPEVNIDTLDLSSADQSPAHLNRRACRRKARSVYRKYTGVGTGVSVLVSPIPGASSIPLAALETKMTMEIAKIYGYNLNSKQVTAIVGGMLAGGAVLKVAVMEAMSFVPGVGWAIKGFVAGSAITALGEAMIKYFERRRFPALPGNPDIEQSE